MEIPTEAATDKPLDPRSIEGWQILSFCSSSVELMGNYQIFIIRLYRKC